MDKMTFIRKNDDGNELACEECYFHAVCPCMGVPIFDCNPYDYWEIEK